MKCNILTITLLHAGIRIDQLPEREQVKLRMGPVEIGTTGVAAAAVLESRSTAVAVSGGTKAAPPPGHPHTMSTPEANLHSGSFFQLPHAHFHTPPHPSTSTVSSHAQMQVPGSYWHRS
jgi:hypothetical protein